MLNLIFLFILLLGIPKAVTRFLEEWLRDDQKRRLRERFESWWLTVPTAGNITNSAAFSANTFFFGTTNTDGSNGGLFVAYSFGRKPSTVDTNLTQAQQWSNDLATIQKGVEKYDTTENATLYSIGYYVVILIANILLCFCSLVLCRIVLREICLARRTVAVVSLLISNFFVVSIISSISLLALLVLSVPLLWLLLPFVPIVAKQSFLVFAVLGLGASFSVWAMNCVPLSVITVIAFLPSFFAIFAIFISLLLIIGRNRLHSLVSAVLLRCAEKSPFAVIGACSALIIAIISALAKLLRGTF